MIGSDLGITTVDEACRVVRALGGHRYVVGRQHLESERLHGVTGEHRLRFTELHMHCGFATPHHVVVHAGHVVMNERVSMNQFDCTGSAKSSLTQAVHRLCGSQHQQRSHALAAVKYAVSHGRAQASRGVGWNPSLQCRLDSANLGAYPGIEFDQLHSAVQGFNWPSSSTLTCCSTASRRTRQKLNNSEPRL